jgi:hypothetical protein
MDFWDKKNRLYEQLKLFSGILNNMLIIKNTDQKKMKKTDEIEKITFLRTFYQISF